MTQFRSETMPAPSPARRIAQVFVEAGVPGTPWTLDRAFAIFTDGEQDLVLTAAPGELPRERELLGLTRAQVRGQFGEVRWPN